jgi:hypothetical protein
MSDASLARKWRMRAAELRAIADGMAILDDKDGLLRLADSLAAMAQPAQEDDPSGEMAASGTQDDIAQNAVRELEALMDLWGIDDSNKRQEALTKQQEEDEGDRQLVAQRRRGTHPERIAIQGVVLPGC